MADDSTIPASPSMLTLPMQPAFQIDTELQAQLDASLSRALGGNDTIPAAGAALQGPTSGQSFIGIGPEGAGGPARIPFQFATLADSVPGSGLGGNVSLPGADLMPPLYIAPAIEPIVRADIAGSSTIGLSDGTFLTFGDISILAGNL